MIKSTVSSKGQIVIPREIRSRLNLKTGTELSFDVQGEALVLRRIVHDHPDWRTMEGMFKDGPDLLKDLADDRAAEIAHDNARIARIKGR